MSEYRRRGKTQATPSEPCSVRRASCAALWPRSSPPRVDPRPGHTAWVRGPCGLPIGGPPESRRLAPARSGGANRTAVGVKRPEPPDRTHARRRIDWSGWWPLAPTPCAIAGVSVRLSALYPWGPPFDQPPRPSPSGSFDVARGPWPGAWCRCESFTGRHLGRESTHVPGTSVRHNSIIAAPKNSTPFQWCRQAGSVALRSSFRFIVARLSKSRSEAVTASH